MRPATFVRFAVGGLLALGVSITLAAQAAERMLYVSVFDEKTRAPVTGLGPSDFVVKEDGATREVLRVTPASSPMSIAVIVDNSQAATDTIPDLRKAVAAFVRDIDGLGPVAIVTVADRPTILRDYTTDQKQLQDAANRIFAMPQSGATLLDAIIEISKGLENREADRAALVVVTTENIEYSTRHYREVLDALKKGGAMMSALVLTGPGSTSLDDAARNRASVLDLGPKSSGGVRFDVVTSLGYEGRMQEIAKILKSQHQVIYARPQRLLPPDSIEVTTSKAGLVASGAPARGQAIR